MYDDIGAGSIMALGAAATRSGADRRRWTSAWRPTTSPWVIRDRGTEEAACLAHIRLT
jgi:hypothetical protein